MAGNYLFVVSMDVDQAHEALFNEVYDTEHVPLLMKVPGVVSVRRFRTTPFDVSIGGEVKRVEPGDEPTYIAIYEIENPAVLVSDAWSAAVEEGRWPTEVRPYTHNRKHSLKAPL